MNISQTQIARQNTFPNYLSIKNDVKTGNIDKIKNYVKEQGLLNRPFKNGNSLLSMAAKYGQSKIVLYLIDNHAIQYPNLKNKFPEQRTENKEILNLLQNSPKLSLLDILENEKTTLNSLEEIQSHLEILFNVKPKILLHEKEVMKHCSFVALFFPEFASIILNYFQKKNDIKFLIECFLKVAIHCCDENLLESCYCTLSNENIQKLSQDFKLYLSNKLNIMTNNLTVFSYINYYFFEETLNNIITEMMDDLITRVSINDKEIKKYRLSLAIHTKNMSVGNNIKNAVSYTYKHELNGNKNIKKILRMMLTNIYNQLTL